MIRERKGSEREKQRISIIYFTAVWLESQAYKGARLSHLLLICGRAKEECHYILVLQLLWAQVLQAHVPPAADDLHCLESPAILLCIFFVSHMGAGRWEGLPSSRFL